MELMALDVIFAILGSSRLFREAVGYFGQQQAISWHRLGKFLLRISDAKPATQALPTPSSPWSASARWP